MLHLIIFIYSIISSDAPSYTRTSKPVQFSIQSTTRSFSLFHNTRSIILLTSTLSWPLAILVYLCKLLCSKNVYPHTAFFQRITPKAIVIPTIKPIHSYLPAYITYSIRSPIQIIPRPLPFFTILHHCTNFKIWNLELDPYDSRTNTSTINHCTVTHIIQQDDQTFLNLFNLLNTSNDIIYSTSYFHSL